MIDARQVASPNEACSKARESSNRREVEKWEDDQRNDLSRKVRETTFMFCLSEVNHNILMWSHYADGHKGICVEFRPGDPSHLNFFANARQVNYDKDYPAVQFYKTSLDEKVKLCILRKAREWEYEKERRVLDFGERPGFREIPAGLISGVIMGHCISEENRDWVLELVREHPTPITVYQARRRKDSYALEIEPLKGH